MALTDPKIRALKPTESQYKKFDEKGLYVLVKPNGSKLWQHKFNVGGKEKVLSYGPYPEVSLAQARKKRDESRQTLFAGKDPALERKKAKAAAKLGSENSFVRLAEEFIEKQRKEGRAPSTLRKSEWFLSLLKPTIGSMPINEIEPQFVLAALKKIEAKGHYETAKKTRSFSSRVFRYAVATGRGNSDPASLLNFALISPSPRNYSAIIEPTELGALLRAIDTYTGYPLTCLALKLAPHVFLRPGELRGASWDEIDFDNAVWAIPAERMKARKAHSFPLSHQSLELLKQARDHSGPDGLIFHAFHSNRKPMSENTINQALRRLGFSKEVVSAHGFRATASTLLNQSGKWNPDAIERALAHGDSSAVRGAYHRAQYWDERVLMAQWWSDQLDAWKAA